MKFVLFYLLLSVHTSAFAGDPSCNEVLSGLSGEVQSSIRDLAKLRFDLDQRIARGENALVTRALQNQYHEKEVELLAMSKLDHEAFLVTVKSEINALQKKLRVDEANRNQSKIVEGQELSDSFIPHQPTLIRKFQAPRSSAALGFLPDGRVLMVGGLIGGRYTQLVDAIDLKTGVTESMGELLQIRRFSHDAFLSDGKVLILYDPSSKKSSAPIELFDPNTKTSVDLGELSEPKNYFAQSLLSDDRVLITGGINYGTEISTIELIDTMNGRIEVIGELKEMRYQHAQSTLQSGEVIIVGGSGKLGNLTSIERFDPKSRKSEVVGNLIEGRSRHAQTLLPDGRIVVSGGIGNDGTLTSIEIIDVNTGTSKVIGHLNVPRYDHYHSLLANGRLLVMGGEADEIEAIDLTTGVSEVLSTIDRRGYTFLSLPDGALIVGNSVERIQVGRK